MANELNKFLLFIFTLIYSFGLVPMLIIGDSEYTSHNYYTSIIIMLIMQIILIVIARYVIHNVSDYIWCLFMQISIIMMSHSAGLLVMYFMHNSAYTVFFTLPTFIMGFLTLLCIGAATFMLYLIFLLWYKQSF